MAKTSGINSTRKSSESRKMPGHGKRLTGDSTFKSPRRKRVGRMVVSQREPEAKPDLTIKDARFGAVNVDERPAVRSAERLVKSPARELPECVCRYSHTRRARTGETCEHPKHEQMSAHDKDRRASFGASAMIAGR